MADRIGAEMRGIVQGLKTVDKKFASAVRKEIRTAVKSAGGDILVKIRQEASWSKRIPKATTLRPNFTAKSAGVRIVTSRARAPHARPYEFGNLSPEELINGTGGRMPTRPFFFQSVDMLDKKTQKRILVAIDQAVRDAVKAR